MKKFISLPTWLLMRSTIYPEGHPWNDRNFTLAEWHAGTTGTSRDFDISVWLAVILFSLLAVMLLHGCG